MEIAWKIFFIKSHSTIFQINKKNPLTLFLFFFLSRISFNKKLFISTNVEGNTADETEIALFKSEIERKKFNKFHMWLETAVALLNNSILFFSLSHVMRWQTKKNCFSFLKFLSLHKKLFIILFVWTVKENFQIFLSLSLSLTAPPRLKLNKIKYLKMLNFVFASMKRKSFSFFKVVSKENELKTLFCFLFICLKKIYKPYNSIYFPPTFHFIICLCIAMCRRMKNGWKTLRLVFKFSSFFSIEMMTLERGKNIVW